MTGGPRLHFAPTPADARVSTTEPGRPAVVATPRPSVDAASPEVNATAAGLIRVLDDSGRAIGHWAGSLTSDEMLAGLIDMTTVREFDAAMLRAHRQGKTSFYMQSLGEEAVSCAHRRALADGDMAFPTYRQQGLLITAGYPLVDMMNQVFSNAADPMRGRQLPVFYSSKQHGFFSISGNLGTQFIHAVGWAMAAAIDRTDHIASAWIGEGATAESDFHAALVFASTYQAPVILNIVNNQWAISTPQSVARGATQTFADRGRGFGLPSLVVDGNDFLAVHAVSRWAADRARMGHGPTVIEWVTYRAGAHSTSDDPSAYRPRDAWRDWPGGDPVERLVEHLTVQHGFTQGDREAIEADARRHVADALADAERNGTVKDGPWSDPATMFDDVFAEPTPALVAQRVKAGL